MTHEEQVDRILDAVVARYGLSKRQRVDQEPAVRMVVTALGFIGASIQFNEEESNAQDESSRSSK